MKSQEVRWISAGAVLLSLLGSVLSGASAQALEVSVLPAKIEEVDADEAERIAPISNHFWDEYQQAGDPGLLQQNHPTNSVADPATIIAGAQAGAIILDALVNLGKTIWQIIEAGRPKVNVSMDVASAIPQGVKHWSELEGWKDPSTKLYRVQLLQSAEKSLGDIYFRLIFAHGGSVKGKGKYLANVTVVPAQIFVPYRRDFYAKAEVVQMMNHGKKTNPLAGITMLVQWGLRSTWYASEQSVSIHVRGDGGVKALAGPTEQPEDLSAPVRRGEPPKPVSPIIFW